MILAPTHGLHTLKRGPADAASFGAVEKAVTTKRVNTIRYEMLF